MGIEQRPFHLTLPNQLGRPKDYTSHVPGAHVTADLRLLLGKVVVLLSPLALVRAHAAQPLHVGETVVKRTAGQAVVLVD